MKKNQDLFNTYVWRFEAYEDLFLMFFFKDPIQWMLKATHDFQKEILSCGVSVIRGLKHDMDIMTFAIPLELNFLQRQHLIEMHEKVPVKPFDCGKEI